MGDMKEIQRNKSVSHVFFFANMLFPDFSPLIHITIFMSNKIRGEQNSSYDIKLWFKCCYLQFLKYSLAYTANIQTQ